MNKPALISNLCLSKILKILQNEFKNLVFGEAELKKGQVRLRFIFYDEDMNSYKPFAGLKAILEKSNKKTEPTIIIGFESLKLIQRFMEAKVLYQPGVSYLYYLSAIEEMEDTIKKVLHTTGQKQVPNNLLNNEGLRNDLSQFGHKLKNVFNSLCERQKMLKYNNHEERVAIYESLAKASSEYLFWYKIKIDYLIDNIQGAELMPKVISQIKQIQGYIDRAEINWSQILALAANPFSEETAEVVYKEMTKVIEPIRQVLDITEEIQAKLVNDRVNK